MTNRMILQDSMLGQPPVGALGWSGVQRQLAADTAPGYESRVLLADQAISTDTETNINSLSLSLLANVRYYYEFFGHYTRTGTNDAGFLFDFTGNAIASGDRARGEYIDGSDTEVSDSTVDPFSLMTFGTNTVDRLFRVQGFFSCTTAGILTAQARQATADANDLTVYAGTRIIFQPIINLAYQSNP